MRFGASGSEVGSRHQEQNREGGKAQSEKYMTGWIGLLHCSFLFNCLKEGPTYKQHKQTSI